MEVCLCFHHGSVTGKFLPETSDNCTGLKQSYLYSKLDLERALLYKN